MWCLSRSYVRLRPYYQVAFARRNALGGEDKNRGALTVRDTGDSFTDPRVYRNKHNVTAQIKTHRKTQKLLHEEQQKRDMNRFHINTLDEADLRAGKREGGLSQSELLAVRNMDAEVAMGPAVSDDSYNVNVRHQLMQREVDRRDHMIDKYGQPPTAREFNTLFRRLRAMDDDDAVIERHQTRLMEEHGISASTRFDAYMLDDDSYFPEWVHALPFSIRDRVKYGSLGLTEVDEVTRVRLGRIPRDKRYKELQRIKASKEYAAANEETLTATELRNLRQGKRRFHWLQRKRQKRASQLRRMALRKADVYEQWPSSVTDYSQRLAFVAQHVENGVDTRGQWPLDEPTLLQAKMKRQQEAAERTFLRSADEQKAARRASMHGGIRELLSSLEQTPAVPRHVSRKVYANRVNAVVHGDQDEFGHKYRKMQLLAMHRVKPYGSLTEIAAEKEVRAEPRINVAGLNHPTDEFWTRHHKSWFEGMPSMRFGS